MKSEAVEKRVLNRLNSLTKPPGSLGRLEEIALRFAVIRGEDMPSPARKGMYVFCADHGVTQEGVSPYPQSVTREMMRNMVDGGAAISVLCRRLEIRPSLVDVGACGSVVPGVVDCRIASGTRNFAVEPAMTREEADRALVTGRDRAFEASHHYDLTGLGEMGIGNTTTAAALLSVFTGRDPDETVGPGTGADPATLARKVSAVRRGLELHQPDPADPVGVLAAVGGFEIGAIAGFLLGARERRLPVVLDGFPCCAGALVARAIRPDVLDVAFFAHASAERGHQLMLEVLGGQPYLSLGMRLGEGTGAALAMSLMDAAVRLYREMATFEEADVSRSSHNTRGARTLPT